MARLSNSRGMQIDVPDAAAASYIERGWKPPTPLPPAEERPARKRRSKPKPRIDDEGDANAVPPRADGPA